VVLGADGAGGVIASLLGGADGIGAVISAGGVAGATGIVCATAAVLTSSAAARAIIFIIDLQCRKRERKRAPT